MSRKHPLTDKLLCVWGRECSTEDDPHECTEPAVGVVAVRDNGAFHKLMVCMRHRAALIEETAPIGPA